MATITDTLSVVYSASQGVAGAPGINTTVAAQVVALSGDNAQTVSKTIPASTTNTQLHVAFPRAGLQMLLMICDQPLTVKTNSTSAPDNTFLLQAGVPFLWFLGGYSGNPVSADIATLYVTNAQPIAANFTLRALYN